MTHAMLAADPTCTTLLAAALNGAMSRDAEARARYLAIYGEEWSSLGNGAEVRDDASTRASTVLA
ncbi:MAG: hypothetical protein ACTHU0_14485 [Kofleriaceae bacterium]